MSNWTQSFSAQFSAAACTDAAALSTHSIQGIQPACVCTPESEAQAAEIIRFAAAHKIPVVPFGGGTSQGRCAPPPPGFLALSTKRLNKLIHHEPGDMVATVQGGMTIHEFQKSASSARPMVADRRAGQRNDRRHRRGKYVRSAIVGIRNAARHGAGHDGH